MEVTPFCSINGKNRVFLKGFVSGANYVLKHWTVYNGMYVNDTRTDRYYGRNSVLRCLDMKRCSLKLLFLPAFIHSKLLRTYNVKVSWPTFEIFHSHKNLNEKYWFDFKVVQLSYTEISIILCTKCVWIWLNSNWHKVTEKSFELRCLNKSRTQRRNFIGFVN